MFDIHDVVTIFCAIAGGSDPDLSRTLRQSNPSTAQLRRAATFMCRDPRIRTGIVNAIQAIREEKPAEPQDT